MEKISLKKCQSLLESDGSIYTEQEVIEIRDFLYMLAELDYGVYEKQKNTESEFQKDKGNFQKDKENCSPCTMPSFTE